MATHDHSDPRPSLVPKTALAVMMGLGVLLAMFKFSGGDRDRPNPDTPTATDGTVEMVVDFGGERPGEQSKQEFKKIAWRSKMTVGDLMDQLAETSSEFAYMHEGTDAGAKLVSISGIQSQGGGQDAKNWMFYINGQLAKQSYAVTDLNPGDTVLWKLESYEYNEAE